MGLKCRNIEALRLALQNDCEEKKPGGQLKHQFLNCVVSTYDTGSVVIQDNTTDKIVKKSVEDLIKSINDLNIATCDKK